MKLLNVSNLIWPIWKETPFVGVKGIYKVKKMVLNLFVKLIIWKIGTVQKHLSTSCRAPFLEIIFSENASTIAIRMSFKVKVDRLEIALILVAIW